MKKNILANILVASVVATAFITGLQSCNKEIPGAIPITTTQNIVTINGFLTSDTSFSFFNAAVIKAGLTPLLADSTSSVTVFAPGNAAFKLFATAASGGVINAGSSNAAVIGFINSLPATTIVPLISYLIIPGREFLFSDIPTTFPNIQLPSAFTIGVLPGTTVPVKLSVFPSRRANTFFLNTTPVTAFDMHFRNGVVHIISGLVTPPGLLIAAAPPAASILYSDPQFTIFDSLIAKGDLAQPNPALKVDSILKNAGANLTLFAPTNTAMKNFLNAATGGALAGAPDAAYFGFIRTTFPATSAQGIVLYHLMGMRAFSVNFSSTTTLYPTLLNGGIPTHPGVGVQAFFKAGGLGVDSLKVFGAANGGIPATSKPSTNFDKNAVNGVVHIIDGVLLPL